MRPSFYQVVNFAKFKTTQSTREILILRLRTSYRNDIIRKIYITHSYQVPSTEIAMQTQFNDPLNKCRIFTVCRVIRVSACFSFAVLVNAS